MRHVWSLAGILVLVLGVGCDLTDRLRAAASGGTGGTLDSGESDTNVAGRVSAGGHGGATNGGTGGRAGAGNAAYSGGRGGVGGMSSGGKGGKGGAAASGGGRGGSNTGGAAASGSGGAGGAGGTGSSPSDAEYAACLSDAQSAGQAVDDCTRCLCQADKCRTKLTTATFDSKANAVVTCSQKKSCTDLCCLCGTKSCSYSNYATGPCASQIETAAGVPPGRGIAQNGPQVMKNCASDAADDNSCRRVVQLMDCERQSCSDVCPVSTTCQ